MDVCVWVFEWAFGLEGGGGGTSKDDGILSQPLPLLPGKALIPVGMLLVGKALSPVGILLLLVLIAAADKTT